MVLIMRLCLYARRLIIILCFETLVSCLLWSQSLDTNRDALINESTAPTEEKVELEQDISAFIGLTLKELITKFGVPYEVYALRGPESWQDDVVFIYEQGDFYIYRDRVWQVSIKTACDIIVGDDWNTVQLLMGTAQYKFDRCLIYSLHGSAWPLMIRFNFDEASNVSAIFVYRPDF
ncbi:MAG: hypothetical protein LBB43_05595 [Spirochaetaceae bacterium]|jgi:hypothetical protein|nr:hypothetical protein [Spirochaetaceae bacterium]